MLPTTFWNKVRRFFACGCEAFMFSRSKTGRYVRSISDRSGVFSFSRIWDRLCWGPSMSSLMKRTNVVAEMNSGAAMFVNLCNASSPGQSSGRLVSA